METTNATLEKKIPTRVNGKICYIEIPAVDVQLSANFYKEVFGWNIRKRSDGQIAFDDPLGEISGTWNLCTEISKEPGILMYIMVENLANTVDAISNNGGQIIGQMSEDDYGIIARFSDPAGNTFGLYQERLI